jgi:Integrase core domain
MVNNNLCRVAGVGTININFHDGKIRRLTGVRYIPDLSKNLISLGSLKDKRCKFQSEGGVICVFKGALTIMKGKRVGTLYFLQGYTITGSTAILNSGPTSNMDVTKLWHIRLWHMSERGMTIWSKRGLLCHQCTSRLEFCEYYLFDKQKRFTFSTTIYQTKWTLDYILSDLWVSSYDPSKGNGSRYLLTFIDNFSKNVWVYFLKKKSEVLKVYKEWKTLLENQTGKKIKRLRTNNGLEFYNHQFFKFCKTKGIVRYKMKVNTP